MLLFPTTAAVAWLLEFLRPLFGTTCGTACGFGMLGAPDLAFSPVCPRNWLQLKIAGLPCCDHPFFHAPGCSSLKNHRQTTAPPPDRTYQSSTLKARPTRMNTDSRHRAGRITPYRCTFC